jgi:hypothetical protein
MRYNPLLMLFGNRIARVPAAKRARIARSIRIGQWSIVALALLGWGWSELHDQEAGHGPGDQTVAAAKFDPKEASALAAEINRTWNIEVRYEGDPSTFIIYGDHTPPVWSLGRIDDADIVPGLKAIREALSVYPKSFIAKPYNRVHPIFLVRSITIKGLEVGGMIFGASIYVPTRAMQDPYSVTFAEDTFHHEFSLLAFHQGPSPVEAWSAVNPPGFAYETDSDPDVVRAAGHRPDAGETSDAVHEMGFLEKYAESALEEDWQTYAERAFNHPGDLIDFIKRFPRVKAKARIFIDHYESLDPAFNAYFDRTGLDKAIQ